MKLVSDNGQQPRPSGFDVIETGASLGAEVRGLDLRHIISDQAEDIRRIWNRYSVLLFRNQSMSNLDLLNFSRRLGALDIAPIQENGRRFVDDHPELYVVSNVTVNGEAIGSLGSGVWPLRATRAAPEEAQHARHQRRRQHQRGQRGRFQRRFFRHAPTTNSSGRFVPLAQEGLFPASGLSLAHGTKACLRLPAGGFRPLR